MACKVRYLVVVLVVTVACGDPTQNQATSTEDGARAAALRAQRAQSGCESQIGAFRAELAELDSRLDIGMNNEEYGQRLGDVNVAYDAIPIRRLSPACIEIAATLEDAFNRYIDADNRWDACIEDFACDEPKVQRPWAKAASLIRRATNNLRDLDTFKV